VWFVLASLLLAGSLNANSLDSLDERFEQRSYRRFLLPNGMKVMLISDPTTQKAAASLAVDVGALSDPPNHQGLAHYLEHMLFLGTEKYPEAGEYQQFVSNRGGFANAYTADDHTNYFFEIDPPHLEGALDRFAQFFTAPLFNAEYLERERNIVDSEHSKNIPNDFRRINETRKVAYDAEHPLQKFSTGNSETLGLTTRADVMDFYNRYYSANRMTLAVIGSQSLDELQQLVVPRFYGTPNRDLPQITFPERYLEPSDEFRLLQIRPMRESRTLSLSFPLPPTQHYYRSQPLNLLAFLVGHEGKGSLLSLLKEQNLVTSLSAGTGLSNNSYSAFAITMQLTPDGIRRYRDVITYVFQYVRLLREEGLPRYVYDEVKRMNEIDFEFAERQQGSGAVTGLAALMRFVPLREVETAPFLLTEFRPDLFDSMLYRLTPENMLATLVHKDAKVNQTERFYGTEYSYETGKQSWMRQWKSVKRHPRLALPQPNDFIPQDISVRDAPVPFRFNYESIAGLREENLPPYIADRLARQLNRRWASWRELSANLDLPRENENSVRQIITKHAVEEPTAVVDSPRGQVWFQPDFRFEQPKARVSLRIHTPEAYATPRHAVLTNLYTEAIEEGLNEFKYPVSLAGLDFGLRNTKEGVQITFSGYSDRILELVARVTRQLREVQVNEETFAALKDAQLRSYRNFYLQAPYQQAFYHRSLLLESFRHSIMEYEQIIPDVTLNDVRQHAKRLYQTAYVEGVVYGNLSADQVRPVMRDVVAQLSDQALPQDQLAHNQIRQIPAGTTYTFQRDVNVNNSALVMELQIGEDTPTNWATLQVLSQWVSPQFYTELRTRQQTGYIVNSGSTRSEETLSLYFLIQSGTFAPDDLAGRVQEFLPQLYTGLSRLSEEEFATIRQSVLRGSLERPDDVRGASSRLFNVMFEEEGNFEFQSEKLRALAELEHATFVEQAQQMLAPESQRQLVMQMVAEGMTSRVPAENVVASEQEMVERLPCPEFCLPKL
jgi:insulysin